MKSCWSRISVPRLAKVPSQLTSIKRQGDRMISDDNRLDQAAAKALRAQELLDNAVLTEAFKVLEENYTAAWRATTIEDVPAREKLFLAINIVGKVHDHLSAVVANGKL